MFGLTTVHGTVLYFDRDAQLVLHRPLAEIEMADVVCLTGIETGTFVVADAGAWRIIDVGTPFASRATAVVRADIVFKGGLASFRFPIGFLSATPHGTIRMDAGEVDEWEHFGLVDADGLADLIHFAGHDWIRVATGCRIPREQIALADTRQLRIGDHLYPIDGNFPLSGRQGGQSRNILFRNGWMVEEFKLFSPLVFFVLMGAGAYLDQLRLATQSLVEFGRYDRDILIITDRPHGLVQDAVPELLHPRLWFLDVQSSDKVDAVLARLMLEEFDGAAGHAPFLYSDTDVIFDRDLLPILENVVRSGRMSAQPEPWSELPASSSGGAELFEADPIPIRFDLGFNAGIWAMPGGSDSLHVIATIRRAISSYLLTNGRNSLPWLDQAMANYVLRKLDAFDPALIDQTTRLHQNYAEIDASTPLGFVHFWPVGHRADERVGPMAAYLDRLRAVASERG